MTFMRISARFAALVIAGALIVSCDSRLPTSLDGGQGGGPAGSKPILTFVTPDAGGKLNVGDSLLVSAHLYAQASLKSVTFFGISARGDSALGTDRIVARYTAVTVPASGSFPAGLVDTTVARYLKATVPVDSTPDTVILYGIVTDAAGNADTVLTNVRMVTGPKVTFIAPVPGDSATAGTGLTVTLHATHSVGIAKLGFHLQSTGTGWTTPVDFVSDTTVFATPSKDTTISVTVPIPANAPPKGILTITPISLDVDGQPGSSAQITIAVRAGSPPAPRVVQTVAPRLETNDSIYVSVNGNGITSVGYELTDVATNTVIGTPFTQTQATAQSTVVAALPLNLTGSSQGKKIQVVTFATDQTGATGYSIRSGTSASQTVKANALKDTALIVFGHTYPLPPSRDTLVGDIVVDRARGNVFLSNLGYSRLEVWQRSTRKFDANGIFLGSQPWGMTMSRTATAGDTLYVANSGGTNLSRVYIGAASPSGMKEDLAHRILTRISLLYKITEVLDPSTSKIRITVSDPIMFSDRTQYIQQSAAGRIYLSTKPTPASTKGTIRYMDPKAAAPDQRFILAFATKGSDPNSYLVANIDGASVTPAPAASTASDVLTLCDHKSGSTDDPTCASTSGGIQATIDALRGLVPLTDIEAAPNLDEVSLGLTDTTYSAASADGKWIAFGEGNHAPFSRAFLLQDDGSVADRYSYASPSLNIQDLVNNASDQVFGLALDKTGKTLGLHGVESYFASVAKPFTQRLQGKYATFGQGAGIAFHPEADGINSPAAQRLSFVASNNGTIEMVDIAYYTSRGKLATKANLYGPLRASLPFPTDDPSVVLKLFGLSPSGLVVIDVTAADIQAGP